MKNREAKWLGSVFTFRWPWRILQNDSSGIRAVLPGWARPYARLRRWLGMPLFTIRKLSLLLVMLLTFAGCKRPPVAGVVVRKHHHAAYTTVSYVRVGKTSMPQTHYHPERWTLIVLLDDSDTLTDRDVSHGFYDRTAVGAVYDETQPIEMPDVSK